MKKLLLLIVFAAASFGQNLPLPPDVDAAIAGTVNLEGSITQGVTDLILNVGPTLMPVGWTLLGLFGAYSLLQVLLRSTQHQMAMHHYAPLATVVAYVAVLFRIAVASMMLSFYMVPIPAVGLNFHQIFPRFGQLLENGVTTAAMKEVMGHFNDVIHFLPPVGMFSVMPAIIFLLVVVAILLAQLGMTLITAGSIAIVGVLTVCGPIAIAFYVLPKFDRKFWAWFDGMFSYSMYGFVGSCFILVFCHSYSDFFSGLHGWSVGQWVWNFLYLMLITLPFLWTMFKVPEVTHMIFGGVGGVASGFADTLQSLAVRGIVSLL